MKQDAELTEKLERELANIKDQRDVTMWCFEKCREDRQRVTAELAEAREEIEQLKSQLTRTHGCVTISRNGYVQEIEQQRDRLAEALQRIIEWMDKSGHNDVSLYHQATDALADVKGTKI